LNDTITASPDALRAAMVNRIIARGWACTERVAEAMRTVPRHQFLPTAPVEEAYDDQAVIIKRGPDGTALSCASEPVIVAMMLDQLDVRPGRRILEIGAGTGYNAALLAHLTGPAGHVTTVDIDPDITAHARAALNATGNRHVHVATRDGALGDPEHAPYDRIILTVAAWDLPPAWWHQLTPNGRLVVPLRWRGQTQSIAFNHTNGTLRSDSVELCGFVPMIGQDGERSSPVDPDGHVTLHWDIDQPIQPATVHGILHQPKTAARSHVTVGAEEPFDGIWLRLTATDPRTCRIAADRTAVDTDLCVPAIPTRSPALVDADSLAYLTLRRSTSKTAAWELGATGHGPAGARLAEHICQHIRTWHQDRAARPTITAYPTGTPVGPTVNLNPIHKTHTTLTVSW
jgi:protein-L-isoaspartate(D-aspartate) O-methyltransferase